MEADSRSDVVLESDEGLSLEELRQSYALVLNRGRTQGPDESAGRSAEARLPFPEAFDPTEDALVESDRCPISPLAILEAVLFVGTPDGKPITAEAVAQIMRGVCTQEIDSLVEELNRVYENSHQSMRIQAVGGGYRMQLIDSLKSVRDRFYGRARAVRLTQSAVDCLALVAYRPGISRDEIDDRRGRQSGGVLNQLVRRNLLEVRREGDQKKKWRCYYPTDRLLQTIGLASLEELPQVEDWN